MRRRRLLGIFGSGVAADVAGCVGGDDRPEPLDGEWVLQVRVVNDGDDPASYRVECRAEERESVASAFGTLPAGDRQDLSLSGKLFDERREVFATSDSGAASVPWDTRECRRLFAAVGVGGDRTTLETECRQE